MKERKAIEPVKMESAPLQVYFEELKNEQETLELRIKEEETKGVQTNQEINQITSKQNAKENGLMEIEQELAGKIDLLKNHETRVKQGTEKIKQMKESEPWLETEMHLFGKEGTKYNFKDVEPLVLQEDLKMMDEAREELRKRVNPNVDL